MYTSGTKLKLRADQAEADLPKEITITSIEGDAILVTSEAGTFESNADILDAFYEKAEEFSLETMPKLTLEALDEVIALFDVYAATQSPVAGIQVKTKLTLLKDAIEKATGKKVIVHSILGKKVA